MPVTLSAVSRSPERSERGAQRSVHARRAGGTSVVEGSGSSDEEILRCAQSLPLSAAKG